MIVNQYQHITVKLLPPREKKVAYLFSGHRAVTVSGIEYNIPLLITHRKKQSHE